MTNDFIQHTRKVLTLEECKSLIHFYENNTKYHKYGATGSGNVDYKKKKCMEMYISSNAIHPKNEHFCNIRRALLDSTDQYRTKYPFLNQVGTWDLAPAFNIKKYLPKEGYFVTHCENDGYVNCEIDNRLIAWMFYLNDVTDGGETEFPTQCKKFAPRAGDVLIWPSYWTHPHHGLPSPSQIKYIVSGWFTYTND